MSSSVAYAAAGLAGVLVVNALLWPWLGESARIGVAAAGAVAWGVQIVAFGLLVRYRESSRGFLTAWVGGTLVRMALILLAAWAVVRSPALEPAPTLLGLAGFFYALLLLEALFFGRGQSRTDTA